jgi:hypothetical protein
MEGRGGSWRVMHRSRLSGMETCPCGGRYPRPPCQSTYFLVHQCLLERSIRHQCPFQHTGYRQDAAADEMPRIVMCACDSIPSPAPVGHASSRENTTQFALHRIMHEMKSLCEPPVIFLNRQVALANGLPRPTPACMPACSPHGSIVHGSGRTHQTVDPVAINRCCACPCDSWKSPLSCISERELCPLLSGFFLLLLSLST